MFFICMNSWHDALPFLCCEFSLKIKESGSCCWSKEARVFKQNWLKVEEAPRGLGLICYFCLHPIFTFHFFCLSCENLEFENGRKTRLGFGGGEFLPHLREIDQVMHMYELVRWCFTFFVLWVFIKSQRIRFLLWKQRGARFQTKLAEGWRR